MDLRGQKAVTIGEKRFCVDSGRYSDKQYKTPCSVELC